MEPIPPLSELIARIDAELAPISRWSAPARPGPPAAPRPQPLPLIHFRIAGIQMAVPFSRVQEIGRHAQVTPLPNLPEWVMGVFQIRGEIFSMVDLNRFFRLGGEPREAPGYFMVLRSEQMQAGIRVNRLIGLRPGARRGGGIRPDGNGGSRGERRLRTFLSDGTGPDGNPVWLLNVDRLLGSPELNAFSR